MQNILNLKVTDIPYLKELENEFMVQYEDIPKIQHDYIKQLEDGLKGQTSSLLMMPSYISKFPTGNEKGDFFGIDIGGTNIRVLRLQLLGDSKVRKSDFKKYDVPKCIYKATADEFFLWIAEKFKTYVTEHNYKLDTRFMIGFCFSFPMDFTSHKEATLLRWTKDFEIKGGLDTPCNVQLQEALIKQGIKNCYVSVVVNDAIGAFAASKHVFPKTQICIILGTGSNACYLEPIKNIKKIKDGSYYKEAGETDKDVINIEWAVYKCPYLPSSKQDKENDLESLVPGMSIFEKLVASKYLGKLTKKLFLEMVVLRMQSQESQIDPQVHENIKQNKTFDAVCITKIINSISDKDLVICHDYLRDVFGVPDKLIDQDMKNDLSRACKWVIQRGALLVSIVTATLVERVLDQENANTEIEITVEGSMYEKMDMLHQKFDEYLKEALKLGKRDVKIAIKKSSEQPAMGAALLAAYFAQT